MNDVRRMPAGMAGEPEAGACKSCGVVVVDTQAHLDWHKMVRDYIDDQNTLKAKIDKMFHWQVIVVVATFVILALGVARFFDILGLT